MKIKLVFEDWQHLGRSVRQTEKGTELSTGKFHGGTTFNGEIKLNEEDEIELREAVKEGYHPVFWVTN